jgi:hypothetical protein
MDTGVIGNESYTLPNVLHEHAESDKNVGRPKESEMYNQPSRRNKT